MIHFCLMCMQYHPRQVVTVTEKESDGLIYDAEYEYCPETDDYLETEEMMKNNAAAYLTAEHNMAVMRRRTTMHKHAERIQEGIDEIIDVIKEAIDRGQDVSITTSVGLVEIEPEKQFKRFERDGSRIITIEIAPFGRDKAETVQFYLDTSPRCVEQKRDE